MNCENSNNKPTNFIRNIVKQDLSSEKHKTVVTRFPPEPNGYLHIGHAKSICLNFGTARDYGGWCNLRFDDTNPAKEDAEYINSIKKDVSWLGFDWSDKVKYSSDYFEKFYQCATELIAKGMAYVCFLSPDEAKEYRGTLTNPGINSPYRNSSKEENLVLFKKMKKGEYKEGECVLRGKIDMSSSFMCMRDPIFYRIRFDKHHQTGDKWCIYPMYDFAHCISDAIEGVTHSLCTLEFQDNRRPYDWILDNLDEFNKSHRPRQYEFSRLNLEYTVMSKRKLQKLVEDNLVSGWNDPRMPTLSGLRRRGYTSAAIRDFAERIGISKVDSVTDVRILEASIRNDLNVVAPRTMAVLNPIKLVIENYSENELETIQAPIHPQNEEMGKRKILFGRELYIEKDDFLEISPDKKFKRLTLGKEVRLRNAYVIKANHIEFDKNQDLSTIYCTYDPETLGKKPSDGRKIKGVIHFVEASQSIKAEFRIYDRLFLNPNPGSLEDLASALNPESIKIRKGFVEPTMLNAKPEMSYQFERVGYFCRDNKSDKLVFNKTVSLRDSYK